MQFAAGPLTVAAARALALVLGTYGVGTAWFAWHGFRSGLADRWSAGVCTLTVLLLAAFLWTHPQAMPAPFSIWLLVLVFVGLVVMFTWTLGRYQERIDRFREEFGGRLTALLAERLPEERLAEWRSLRDRFSLSREERRKAPHLMMGAFFVLYLGVGFALLRGAWSSARGSGEGEAVFNLFEASHSGVLAAGHVTVLFGLVALLVLIVPNELLRLKYPELSYPFKTTILRRLRAREKGLFGAHYYIVASLPLSLLWLTRDPASWDRTVPAGMALLAVTVFADAASALVGIRLGKRKWFHNRGKSYLGTVGGTAVAFLVSLPLTGLPAAAAAAAVFFAIDVVAPVPIPVSDNLLNPLALALVYGAMVGQLDPLVPYL